MRLRRVAALLAGALTGVFLATGVSIAQDEPYPVELKVGETIELCTSGLIVCPARAPICDDPNVAAPVDAASGLGFKGIGPGTTLCSAASAVGPRRVFRITVR